MLSSGASSISKYTHADNSNPGDGSSYLRARRSICLPDVVGQKAKSRLLRDRPIRAATCFVAIWRFRCSFGAGFLDQLTEQTHLARAPLPVMQDIVVSAAEATQREIDLAVR